MSVRCRITFSLRLKLIEKPVFFLISDFLPPEYISLSGGFNMVLTKGLLMLW